MSYKPERALTLVTLLEWELTVHISRNELQAREGIDTLLSYVLECSTSLHVEMSYKPERALTPRRNLNILSSLYEVEMSYKPERALTQDIAVSHLLALTMM